MRNGFLLIQFIAYFVGISFAAGGGNHPGLSAGLIIQLKALCLCMPLLGGMIGVIVERRRLFDALGRVVQRNQWLLLYVVLAMFSLPLAVDMAYSGQRLIYFVFALSGLLMLIAQYSDISYDVLIKHVTIITVIALIFPCYVLVLHGFQNLIPGYRFDVQSYLLIHPNLLASFYAHLALFHMAVIFYSVNQRPWIQKICLALLMVMIFLLFSRAVFISMAITAMILSFVLYALRRNTLYMVFPMAIWAAACLGLIFVVMGIIDASSAMSVLVRGNDAASLATLTNRTELWAILLDELSWKIFFVGHGYSVMTESFGIDFGTGILYGAHNGYLSVLLGTGIFSLLAIILYLLHGFSVVKRHSGSTPIFVTITTLGSLLLLMVNCLTAEEIGVSMTVTFAYVVFITTLFGNVSKKERA